MNKQFRFSSAQQFRVVTQGVHFYSTAKEIRAGVGDEHKTNLSLQRALHALEMTRSGTDLGAVASGIAGEWEQRRVQLDMIDIPR